MFRTMWARQLFSLAALLVIASAAFPQTPASSFPPPSPGAPTVASGEEAELKAHLEQLQKKTQQIRDAISAIEEQRAGGKASATEQEAPSHLNALDVQQLIDRYFADRDQSRKAEQQAKAAEGYKVGTDLSMSASWTIGKGLLLQTQNKDFWMHIGSRFQYDNDFFQQSTIMLSKPPVGVNPYVDGNYFRRIRPIFEGGFWDICEFNVELQLENISNGATALDDVWVGVKDVPFLGTIRAGHFHLPHGLEPDMYSSSRAGIFLERYSGNAAFLDQRSSGLLLTNAFFQEHMTYAAMIFRPDNANNGNQFADGDYAAIGRLTFLPIYANEGRDLLHLGGAVTWKHALNGVTSFAAGPQINDFAGGDNAYGTPVSATTAITVNPTLKNAAGVPVAITASAALTGFKPAPGNNTSWVSTGNVLANSTTVLGGEALWIHGPFSLQAEADWAFMNNANVAGANQGNLGFASYYVQVSYILTGENRLYNTRLGRLPRDYIAPPNQPFWLVRDENRNFNWGLGAWEIAARFSRIDLNSGIVQGGIMDNTEAALNWVPNNNVRIQFMFIHTDRFSMPSNASSGWLNGLGIRTQLMF